MENIVLRDSRANKGWMHDIRQKLPPPKVFSPNFFLPFHPSFPGGVSTPMLVPSSNEAKNLGEIYLRYKYRWLIVTTNTFARISSGTESSDLSRQSWKERKGSWITGAQSTWPAPPPPETFHRNPRIRFANTRWNLACVVFAVWNIFFLQRGGKKKCISWRRIITFLLPSYVIFQIPKDKGNLEFGKFRKFRYFIKFIVQNFFFFFFFNYNVLCVYNIGRNV